MLLVTLSINALQLDFFKSGVMNDPSVFNRRYTEMKLATKAEVTIGDNIRAVMATVVEIDNTVLQTTMLLLRSLIFRIRFNSNKIQTQCQQEVIDLSLLSNRQDHAVQQNLDKIDQLILILHGNFHETRTVKELSNKEIWIKVSRKYYICIIFEFRFECK